MLGLVFKSIFGVGVGWGIWLVFLEVGMCDGKEYGIKSYNGVVVLVLGGGVVFFLGILEILIGV